MDMSRVDCPLHGESKYTPANAVEATAYALHEQAVMVWRASINHGMANLAKTALQLSVTHAHSLLNKLETGEAYGLWRVAWKIGDKEGHGAWQRDETVVDAAVKFGNTEYGANTHRKERK